MLFCRDWIIRSKPVSPHWSFQVYKSPIRLPTASPAGQTPGRRARAAAISPTASPLHQKAPGEMESRAPSSTLMGGLLRCKDPRRGHLALGWPWEVCGLLSRDSAQPQIPPPWLRHPPLPPDPPLAEHSLVCRLTPVRLFSSEYPPFTSTSTRERYGHPRGGEKTMI